ncbi:MAG: hypothetical protein JJ872_12040 [Marivivens sp.]|nr:hypothetical protein [Marivivens sp.]
MAIKVEHEIHTRRKGRNLGVGAILVGFIAIVFGLTVVKVIQLGDAGKFERFDHVARPQLVPDAETGTEDGAGE